MKDGVVVSGANSNMLRISNIKESHEGVYKCVVIVIKVVRLSLIQQLLQYMVC